MPTLPLSPLRALVRAKLRELMLLLSQAKELEPETLVEVHNDDTWGLILSVEPWPQTSPAAACCPPAAPPAETAIPPAPDPVAGQVPDAIRGVLGAVPSPLKSTTLALKAGQDPDSSHYRSVLRRMVRSGELVKTDGRYWLASRPLPACTGRLPPPAGARTP